MSFADFLAAIEAQRLLRVARHWDAARGSRIMPSWRDLDPLALRGELAIVWVYRWDPDAGEFIGRLAGEDVERVLGVSLRGRRLDEVQDLAGAAIVRDWYREVMLAPQAMRSTGPVITAIGSAGSAERIALPLGPDRDGPGGVLGAGVYQLAAGGRSRVDPRAIAHAYFPLVDGPS